MSEELFAAMKQSIIDGDEEAAAKENGPQLSDRGREKPAQQQC